MGNRIGTVEYENNEGKNHRVNKYRQFANIDDDFQITEDNINDFALSKTACYCNRSKDQIRCELLGAEWLGENWDDI